MKKLLISSSLALLLASPTLAEYKPPKKPSRAKTTASNGSRNGGCLKDTNLKLTILAPVDNIGETVSLQPKFVWFSPDSQASEIEFSLFEYVDRRGDKIKSFKLHSKHNKPGKMTFSPSEKGFRFTKGKTYLWQVKIVCDRNNTSKNIFAEAVIKIVPTPSDLASELRGTTNPLEKAKIYANRALWYDAFTQAPDNPQGRAFKSEMLKTLSELESKEDLDETERVLQLKQIAEMEL